MFPPAQALMEDQTHGQRVLEWSVVGQTGEMDAPVANGTSIGHKAIVLLKPEAYGTLTLRITKAMATPTKVSFAAYKPCLGTEGAATIVV